jgi:hypothetical protein
LAHSVLPVITEEYEKEWNSIPMKNVEIAEDG